MFKVGFEEGAGIAGAISGCDATDPTLEGFVATGLEYDPAENEELHSLACLGIMNARGACAFSGDGSVLMVLLETPFLAAIRCSCQARKKTIAIVT